MVSRFDVYLVNLDPKLSKDAKNTRPCVVLSPDEMNHNISTVIIAPLSAADALYPTRIPIKFLNSDRMIVLDQIRTVDKARLVKLIGQVDTGERKTVLDRLAEMFVE